MAKDNVDFIKGQPVFNHDTGLSMQRIVALFIEERRRQDQKFGQQNWPILDYDFPVLSKDKESMVDRYSVSGQDHYKNKVELLTKTDRLTYMDILMEELAEVMECEDDYNAMLNELIQLGAVVVAIIESLTRNGK